MTTLADMNRIQEITDTLTQQRDETARKMQNNPAVLYNLEPSEGYDRLACRKCGEVFEVASDMPSDVCFYCLTEPETKPVVTPDMERHFIMLEFDPAFARGGFIFRDERGDLTALPKFNPRPGWQHLGFYDMRNKKYYPKES